MKFMEAAAAMIMVVILCVVASLILWGLYLTVLELMEGAS